jgi:hypothetical protein
MTDYYFTQSTDGGSTWRSPNTRVSQLARARLRRRLPVCGDQLRQPTGDYEGLVSFGGTSHPIWTDSRRQQQAATGCQRPFLMEEVFTATVK